MMRAVFIAHRRVYSLPMLRIFLLLLVTALPLRAETIITPDEFDELSVGRTLYFTRSGRFYGKEQYFENRIVTWKDQSGQCQAGRWSGIGDTICFLYEHDPNLHCWHFLQKETGMAARLIGDDPGDDLNLTAIDTKEVECPVPFLGVSMPATNP